MERIKVADFHNQPLTELEFPDGEVWKVRQPLEADYYRMTEVERAHNARVRAYRKKALKEARALVAEAKAKAEEAKARIEAGGAGDPDEEARLLIDEKGDQEQVPLEVQLRYLQASILAIFITPVQKPERVLEMLGPDIIHQLDLMLKDVFGGDAAKKRMAGTSPPRT